MKGTYLHVEFNPKQAAHIRTLLASGVWGETAEQVVTNLINDSLRREIQTLPKRR